MANLQQKSEASKHEQLDQIIALLAAELDHERRFLDAVNAALELQFADMCARFDAQNSRMAAIAQAVTL